MRSLVHQNNIALDLFVQRPMETVVLVTIVLDQLQELILLVWQVMEELSVPQAIIVKKELQVQPHVHQVRTDQEQEEQVQLLAPLVMPEATVSLLEEQQ